MTKQSNSTDLYGYPTFTQVPYTSSRPNGPESATAKSERLNASTTVLPTTLDRIKYLVDNGLLVIGFSYASNDLTLSDDDGNTYWLNLVDGGLI